MKLSLLVKYLKLIQYIFCGCFIITLIGCYSEPSFGDVFPKQLSNAIINTNYSTLININAGHNVKIYIETYPKDSGIKIKSRNEYGYGVYILYGTPKIDGDIKIHIWGDGFSYSGKKSFDYTYNLHIVKEQEKCQALPIIGNISSFKYQDEILPEAILNKYYLTNPIELQLGKKWSEEDIKIKGLENTGLSLKTSDQYQHIEFYGKPKVIGNILVYVYASLSASKAYPMTPEASSIGKSFIIPIAPINKKQCIE